MKRAKGLEANLWGEPLLGGLENGKNCNEAGKLCPWVSACPERLVRL